MIEEPQSLRDYMSRLGHYGKTYPLISFLAVIALVFAGAHILFYTTSRENAVPLWLLALVLAWRGLGQLLAPRATSFRSQVAAWGLVAVVPLVLLLGGGDLQLGTRAAWLCLVCAVIVYRSGLRGGLHLLPFFTLALVIIPIQEQMFLAFSYPLRLISTMLTVETLQLFGTDISYQLTTIRLSSVEIAITDACSGISQLAVLFLLGYLVVLFKQHRSAGNATLHYLALVPVVIFANAVRLIVTILLFYAIGETAFSNAYHAGLGYCFVILATVLFYWIGALFPDRSQAEASTTQDEEAAEK